MAEYIRPQAADAFAALAIIVASKFVMFNRDTKYSLRLTSKTAKLAVDQELSVLTLSTATQKVPSCFAGVRQLSVFADKENTSVSLAGAPFSRLTSLVLLGKSASTVLPSVGMHPIMRTPLVKVVISDATLLSQHLLTLQLLHNLRTLEMYKVTVRGPAHMGASLLTQLRELSITQSAGNENHLLTCALVQLPGLTKLHYSIRRVQMHGVQLQPLPRMGSNLRILQLDFLDSSLLTAALEGATGLQRLVMCHESCLDEPLAAVLARLPHLHTLEVHELRLSEGAPHPLYALTRMKYDGYNGFDVLDLSKLLGGTTALRQVDRLCFQVSAEAIEERHLSAADLVGRAMRNAGIGKLHFILDHEKGQWGLCKALIKALLLPLHDCSITAVELINHSLDEEATAVLVACLPRVRRVELTNVELDHGTLTPLCRLPEIEEVAVTTCFVGPTKADEDSEIGVQVMRLLVLDYCRQAATAAPPAKPHTLRITSDAYEECREFVERKGWTTVTLRGYGDDA